MSSIGARLRAERERLGYNQTQWAELCRSARKSVFLYETDARRPDADFLAAAAAAGADLLLIITGTTSQSAADALTSEERRLIAYYRSAPAAVRRAAEAALQSALVDKVASSPPGN